MNAMKVMHAVFGQKKWPNHTLYIILLVESIAGLYKFSQRAILALKYARGRKLGFGFFDFF